ncbi:hypothetical protein BV25DRAFT_945522 [Artomyces pyxidatus]|uniref:Uncharacterized protein n=1 Tax=Artomyces pyxidatus TaxID=48021 RepID=A0ACB8SXK3_9AGAM|nr:hypothetical protein BV25DRAFT_945522 [Artomyces pyxidatus]
MLSAIPQSQMLSPSSSAMVIDIGAPPSLSSTKVDPMTEATIGLHADGHAQEGLQLVNRMQSIGLDHDIALPMIAVMGSQSSGKSSLIQGIVGFPLPKADSLCTRCPIECRLARSDGAWQCQVILRMLTDEAGKQRGSPVSYSFGDMITSKDLIEERIFRAQLALLNPKEDFNEFLTCAITGELSFESTFSTNIICLEISGRDEPDLTFVDLPGIIQNVGRDGNPDDISLVEKLVVSYIERDNCFILLTIPCETDFATQGAHTLARRYDPEGKRTVGVLTKPDRIPKGTEKKWLDYVRGEKDSLVCGWYAVKQPDSESLRLGTTWAQARFYEDNFFTEKPWAELYPPWRRHLGTKNLVAKLCELLAELVHKRIPELSNELTSVLDTTSADLLKLPKLPSGDSVSQIHELVGQFRRDVVDHLGKIGGDGLLQAIKLDRTNFKQELRSAAPAFRPWNSSLTKPPAVVQPTFVFDSDDVRVPVGAERGPVIFLDEVVGKMSEFATRGLPDDYSPDIAKSYIRTCTALWRQPTIRLVNAVHNTLSRNIESLVNKTFEHYEYGGFKSEVLHIVGAHLKTCKDRAIEQVEALLRYEQKVHTENAGFYREYLDKFLTHYKAQRAPADGRPALHHLQKSPYNKSSTEKATSDFQASINLVMTHLNKIGVPMSDPTTLAKLLPPDSDATALMVMAQASAFFEDVVHVVAYRRFVDYVLIAVEDELVAGLERGISEALAQGFRFSDANVVERCQALLQESPNIAELRDSLLKKQKRLLDAREQLSLYWDITSS